MVDSKTTQAYFILIAINMTAIGSAIGFGVLISLFANPIAGGIFISVAVMIECLYLKTPSIEC